MGGWLSGNDDDQQQSIRIIDSTGNEDNSPPTITIFQQRDNSHLLCGKTLEQATRLVTEHKIIHNGKQITSISDSDGTINSSQGNCIVNTQEGKIISIFRNF